MNPFLPCKLASIERESTRRMRSLTRTQSQVLATWFIIIFLPLPCQLLAISRPRQQGYATWQQPNPDSQDHHDNAEEIQLYLPAGPPGQFRGATGIMSQDIQSAPVTAFSAYRLAGLSITTGSKNITYDKEELDLTDTFEHTKGYFQCQIPGLYYFSFTFWSRSSTPLKIRLQHNGKTKAGLFVGRGTLLEQTSQNMVLALKHGDRAWLEAYSPSLITASTTPINIFNGYLIHAIN